MKHVKFVPEATILLSMAAHSEVNAIVDPETGKTYVEYPSPIVGPLSKSEPAPGKGEEKSPSKASSENSAKVYTEEELLEMDVRDLMKLCVKMGIDPDEYDGKNTNKKLRLLILDAQDGAPTDDEEEEENAPSPAKPSSKGNKTLEKILNEFDEDGDTAKTVKKLVAEGCDEATAKSVCRKMSKDPDFSVQEAIEMLNEEGDGATPSKPAEKSSGGKRKLVDVQDLQKGDDVEVKIDDEWYPGTVTKAYSEKAGYAVIHCEDGDDVEAEEGDEIRYQ